jgi:hypothetical protein
VSDIEPDVYLVFRTVRDAIRYRRKTGCGGWIFECECDHSAIIFPWRMTPTQILGHRMIRGESGKLHGHVGEDVEA